MRCTPREPSFRGVSQPVSNPSWPLVHPSRNPRTDCYRYRRPTGQTAITTETDNHSQEDLAELLVRHAATLGITLHTTGKQVGRWERGEAVPNHPTRYVIRALTGVPLSSPEAVVPAVQQLTAAIAVVRRDSEVLIVQRRSDDDLFSWQFPAGEVETGERSEDAAVRETHEETGLTVKAVRVLGERVHPNTGRTMVYVACEHLDGAAYVADPEELAEVAWCAYQQLPELVPYGLFGPVQAYLDQTLGQ